MKNSHPNYVSQIYVNVFDKFISLQYIKEIVKKLYEKKFLKKFFSSIHFINFKLTKKFYINFKKYQQKSQQLGKEF